MPNRLAYPTGADYRDALFNPKRAIRDPILSNGTIVIDALGMPKPVSGNFATVYSIEGSDHRRWGVKCFTRHIPDQQQRYERISACLRTLDADWKIDFEYLPEAILCRGAWYPLLKMEWIEATALIPYIEHNLAQPGSLAQLASRFAALVQDLSTAGIAHGDLQHGNLLVTSTGDLKLIDYDGMYVPGLDELGASELGHQNYQLPARSIRTWGSYLDRFSAWLIYSSLVVLTIEPTLWDWLHRNGDESLIFSKSDFADPPGSLAFHALARSPDKRIQAIGHTIESFLALEPNDVPAFDPSVISPPSAQPVTSIGSASRTANQQAAADALSDWLKNLESDPVALAGNSNGPSWLLDHLPPLQPVKFAKKSFPTFMVTLICIIACCLGVTFLWIDHMLSPVSFLILTASVVPIVNLFPLSSYIHTAEYRSLKKVQAEARKIRQESSAASKRVAKTESYRQAVDRHEREALDKLSKLAGKAHDSEASEVAKIDAVLTRRLTEITNEVDALSTSEARERAAVLRNLQDSHVQRSLSVASVASARLVGIGPAIQANLRSSGISTAADFTGISYVGSQVYINLRSGYRVHPNGVGAKKAQALEAWRRSVQARALATQPGSIPNDVALALRRKYLDRRNGLERASVEARAEAARQKQAIHEKWVSTYSNITVQAEAERQKFAKERQDADLLLIEAQRSLNAIRWREAVAKHQRNSYASISYWQYLYRRRSE